MAHILTQLAGEVGRQSPAWIVSSISLFFLLAHPPAYTQPKLQLSFQAGPAIFDNAYQFDPVVQYTISGAMQVRKNFHGITRARFIPAAQSFQTPLGAQTARVDLYDLTVGAKRSGPRLFASRLKPFVALMGGIMLYRPKALDLNIGLGRTVRMQPPNSMQALFSAALGFDLKLTKAIALTFDVDAHVSRINERYVDGASREVWRPFYSASLGILIDSIQ